MDNDQFLDAYLNTLETSEGAGGGDTVTGMATREYGVKDLLGVKEEDYEGNPKGLAKAVAQKNIDELIRMGIDWDNLPLSMKFNSLDIQFNMGSLNKKAPKYFNALKSGNYETAIKQSLDAIGAYDPKRKGERPTKGIAIRRAMFYNLAAKDLGIPTITSINAINQDNAQKSAKVTYNMSEGAAIPITYEFQSLHSTTKPGKVAVTEALGVEATPATEADAQLFTELERYVPATAKPDSAPDMDDSDVVESGTTDTLETVMQEEFQRSVDAADRDEQKQQEATLQTIQSKDVAPDTTDAIPTAEPEEKGLFSRAISGVGEFLFGDDDDTSAEPKVDKNEIIRRSLLKELDTSGVPNMNKGGMPMERQMNMFDEGGLFDEGGTIDEQSGNDVPPGSLKEEVRDDIPAQLSEGEFVFPADVVRYWGLEKLMEMRQEAKAGLARMDAMGQMGNSEEATIPDDLPFTLDDLDMDDDPMEFQVGGLVPNQFGITEQPSQFATYNQQPYVAPTIPTGQPIQQQPLQTGFTPVTTPAVPTDGTVVPTFEQLLPTTTGRYDELKEYINNDTGQTMTIPFVDGKPIYPIPEGFVEVRTDEVEAVETPSITVPTARVTEEDPSDKPDDGLGLGGGRIGMGGFSDGTGRKQDATIMGVSFDGMGEGVLGGIGGAASVAASLATGKPIPAKASATFTYDNETYTVSGTVYNDLKKAGYKGDLADKIVATLKTQSGVRRGSVDYDTKTGTFKDKRSGETFQDKDDDGDGIGDILSKTGQSIYSNVDSDDLIKSGQKLNSSQKAVASAYNDAVFDAFFEDDEDTAPDPRTQQEDDPGESGGTPSQDFSAPSPSYASMSFGERGRAKGGLVNKPKPKAKKMKRGGLASKK